MFTALYTGSLGNQIALALGSGLKAGSWRLTVALPGGAPGVDDNIGGTGADFWQNLAAAVNDGQGVQRGPSQIVVANAGGSAMEPAPFAWTFASGPAGSDGASVSTAALVGVDTVPRQGMYALRGLGCSIGLLADGDDPTQWLTQARFALSEGIDMILSGPAGDSITNALLVKQAAGLDTYACKLMFGDWIGGAIRLTGWFGW